MNSFPATPGLHPARGYSHVAVTPPGARTIYIAGQIALDANDNLVGEGDLAAQLRQALANLQLALGAAGATLADVVKLNTYVVALEPSHRAIIRDVRAEFFGQGPYPASTLVGVTALALPGLMVEVEAIAALS
ncbi:MAG: RidA family protein [Chloroflexi bacterium]|nr:RidA family protein [Chloroflexota bacterium]